MAVKLDRTVCFACGEEEGFVGGVRATAREAADMQDDEYDALPVVPLGDKKLRACLVTGLIKTEDQVCLHYDHMPSAAALAPS